MYAGNDDHINFKHIAKAIKFCLNTCQTHTEVWWCKR